MSTISSKERCRCDAQNTKENRRWLRWWFSQSRHSAGFALLLKQVECGCYLFLSKGGSGGDEVGVGGWRRVEVKACFTSVLLDVRVRYVHQSPRAVTWLHPSKYTPRPLNTASPQKLLMILSGHQITSGCRSAILRGNNFRTSASSH